MAQDPVNITLAEDVFMYATLNRDIEAMNDTARDIVMFFWEIGAERGEELFEKSRKRYLPQRCLTKQQPLFHPSGRNFAGFL